MSDSKHEQYLYGVAYWEEKTLWYACYRDGFISWDTDVFDEEVLRTKDTLVVDECLRAAADEYQRGQIENQPFPVLIHVEAKGAGAAFDRVVLEQRKKVALAKLTNEDKAVLGLKED